MRNLLAAVVLVSAAVACASNVDSPAVGDGGPPVATHPAGPGGEPGPVELDEPRGVEPPGAPPEASSPALGPDRPEAPPVEADARPDGRGPPGSFAPVLLRPQLSERLVIEVYVQAGAEPRPATVERTARILEQVTGKSVRVSGPTPVPGERRQWSADDVRAAADGFAREQQGAGQAVVRVLFLRGGFAESDRALGVAARGDVGAVFVDRIRATGTPLVGAGRIEEAVTLHEVGHLLGLVDLYHDTGRADPEHPGHSPNPGSVMYWAVQSTLVVDVLVGGPSRDFDSADLADLAAIRAGAGG